DIGESTERGGFPGGADEESVAHALEGGAIFIGEANADSVGAVVENNGSRGGSAFENGFSVDADFLRGKTATRGNYGIDLVSDGGATHGVVYSVEDVNNAVNFADGVGDAWSSFVEKFA